MSETLGQVTTYISELLPNAVNSTTIITLINAEQRKLWEHMTQANFYEFNTVEDQAIYSLPTNISIDMVNDLMISDSTGAVSSTHVFQSYSYTGQDEELTGTKFYDALNGLIGIYPIPDNVYPAKLQYQEYFTAFASSDTNTQFNLDQDYIDLIKFRVMARVAKSGKFPNITLANNYESDANKLERKMKVKQAKDKAKTPKRRWGYADWLRE